MTTDLWIFWIAIDRKIDGSISIVQRNVGELFRSKMGILWIPPLYMGFWISWEASIEIDPFRFLKTTPRSISSGSRSTESSIRRRSHPTLMEVACEVFQVYAPAYFLPNTIDDVQYGDGETGEITLLKKR